MNKMLLIEQAIEARTSSYSPYSTFPVGAALLTESGKVFTGCNIENAAYPSSCCAERVAIFAAIAAGERGFKEMAVAADTKRPIPPCGACRQVMSEFFKPIMQIHLTNLHGNSETLTMSELLPYSFKRTDLPTE